MPAFALLLLHVPALSSCAHACLSSVRYSLMTAMNNLPIPLLYCLVRDFPALATDETPTRCVSQLACSRDIRRPRRLLDIDIPAHFNLICRQALFQIATAPACMPIPSRCPITFLLHADVGAAGTSAGQGCVQSILNRFLVDLNGGSCRLTVETSCKISSRLSHTDRHASFWAIRAVHCAFEAAQIEISRTDSIDRLQSVFVCSTIQPYCFQYCQCRYSLKPQSLPRFPP